MCHAADDGTLSGQTTPRPGTMAYGSNLTPDPATGLGDWADIEIVRAMRFGVDDQQVPLCPTMPHFDGTDPEPKYHAYMSDDEAAAIVAWLRGLTPVVRTIPESMCPPIKPPPPVDLAVPPPPDQSVQLDLLAPLTDGGAVD